MLPEWPAVLSCVRFRLRLGRRESICPNCEWPPVHTDRVPIFGKQVRIELIPIIGSNVDITCICQNARKGSHIGGIRIGRRRSGNHCCNHSQNSRQEKKSFHMNASGDWMSRERPGILALLNQQLTSPLPPSGATSR